MTEAPLPSQGTARELLANTQALARRVRNAQRGTWLPLLVFAVITLTAIPLYRLAPRQLARCRPGPQGVSVCTTVIPSVLVYWPVALVAGYAAISAFYVRQSRRRGVGSAIRPYVLAGIALSLLLAACSVWRAFYPLMPKTNGELLHAALTWQVLMTPAVAIGLGLLVLAWVEHNTLLVAFAVGYLAVVVVQAHRVIRSSSQWSFLPLLLVPAAVLLVGSAAFALYQVVSKPRSR